MRQGSRQGGANEGGSERGARAKPGNQLVAHKFNLRQYKQMHCRGPTEA